MSQTWSQQSLKATPVVADQFMIIDSEDSNVNTQIKRVTISSLPGFVADMILGSAQTNTGIKTFLNTTMKLRNVANTFDGFFVNTNTADRIYTLPNTTDTLVGRTTTDTLTNKTFDLTDNTLTGTSAELATAISDETGSGLLVFGTSPTLVTPALGTPSALVLTNATNLPVSGLANGTDGELITWSAAGTPTTVSVGSTGNVLTSNGAGAAPSFQATPQGDMILASVQTVTGAKTFGTIGGAVGKFILAGSTSGSTILNAAAVSGSTTMTLPGTTTTLAGLTISQSWTATQTFQDDTIQISNPADTFQYLIQTSAIVADRTATLPLLAASDTFVFAAFTQTLTNKTLTTPTIASFTNSTHNHQAAAGGGTLVATSALTATGTKDNTTFLRGDDTWASVAVTLNGLTDVTIASAAANQILIYNSGATAMENKTMSGDATIAASGALTIAASFAESTNNLSFFAATTSSQLLGIISDETGSGLLVFGTSPTIVTPTIASFTNSTHNHQAAAGGGTLLSTSALSDTANITYLNTANSYTAGTLQTFLGSIAGTSGLNVGSIAGNPTTQANADIWYNSTSNVLFARINGANVDIGQLGEVFTWTANHNAAGFDLTNVGGITINNPADTFQYIITPAAIAANRILNLPLLTGTDTLVTAAFTQTLSNKTFSSDVTLTGAGTDLITAATAKIRFDGSASGDTYFSEATADSLIATVGGVQAFLMQEIGTEVNLVSGKLSALALAATNGFLHVPTVAGTPTGTPTAYTGKAPLVYDTTNNKLYFFNSSWVATSIETKNTVLAADATEESVTGTTVTKVKDMSFIKSVISWQTLTIEIELKTSSASNPAHCRVRHDELGTDDLDLTTSSTSYVVLSGTIDTSAFSTGRHTVEFYLDDGSGETATIRETWVFGKE